jgi:hypothetical protein
MASTGKVGPGMQVTGNPTLHKLVGSITWNQRIGLDKFLAPVTHRRRGQGQSGARSSLAGFYNLGGFSMARFDG